MSLHPLSMGRRVGVGQVGGGYSWKQAPRFVPAERKVQLILDVLDFPASLQAVADSPAPSWGIQLFAGAPVFADAMQATIFADAVERIREQLELQTDHSVSD